MAGDGPSRGVLHILEVMDAGDCWDKLRSTQVGRFAALVGRQPHIFPVNYLVESDTIVFRTDEGAKLSAVAQAREAAFEIDEHDEEHRIGWSVLVLGHTRRIRDETQMQQWSQRLVPFLTGEKPHYVQLLPDTVSGRRIRTLTD